MDEWMKIQTPNFNLQINSKLQNDACAQNHGTAQITRLSPSPPREERAGERRPFFHKRTDVGLRVLSISGPPGFTRLKFRV
jgi:hypothetical protein